MAWTSKLPLFACACIIVLSACVIYDLNGRSLDFSDSEFVLVVTDSMDGDVTEYAVDSYPADTVAVIHHLPSHEVRFVKVGDVVAYHKGDMLITHRVVSIDYKHSVLTVSGDNASSLEDVNFNDVDGVLVGTNHVMGEFISLVKTHLIEVVCFIGIMFGGVLAIAAYKNLPRGWLTGFRRGTNLRRCTMFALTITAVLGMAFAGVGYAYTASTENSGNNLTSEYVVLSQTNYTLSSDGSFEYYSVTNSDTQGVPCYALYSPTDEYGDTPLLQFVFRTWNVNHYGI